MRILAVDDDPIILDLLPTVLHQSGYSDISVRSSGRAALKILNDPKQEFDTIILDINMPEMDGITLCKRIRQIARYRDVPIIMLTVQSDVGSIERAFAAGANDYITKPFEVTEVGKRVRMVGRLAGQLSEMPVLDPHLSKAETPTGRHSFGPDDPVRLVHGVQQTDLYSLGNYLSQLERGRIDTTCVFAVRLDNTPAYYRMLTEREFADLLTDVTRAISSVLNRSSLLLAYSGAGVFLCISSDDVSGFWPEIEDLLESRLAETVITAQGGLASGVSLTVGRPLRANVSRTHRVRPTFDRAVASMKRRAQVKAKERLMSV